MKKLAKIFIYLGMAGAVIVALFVSILAAIIVGINNPYYYESDLIASIILLVVVVALCAVLCCINIIVGRITLRKMENAKSKDELFSISIICLIFCSIVSGIILLCLDENEFEEGKKIESGVSNLEALETKLNKLKSLKESGAISEEEYNELRKRTIENEL